MSTFMRSRRSQAGIARRRTGHSVRPLVEWLEGREVPATLIGLTSANELVMFDSATPGTTSTAVSITGIGAENILGIDFRPANGKLYALSDGDKLYTVDPTSGTATQVGTGSFAAALDGTAFGFDFNPSKDAIRIVTDSGKNYRLNPDTAELKTDSDLNGDTTNLVGAAYTNNFPGSTTTELFGIDPATDKLVAIDGDPNLGVTKYVGDLGVTTDTNVGFDISTHEGIAYATLTNAGASKLYSIDLTTGAATEIGAVGAAANELVGVTVMEKAVRIYTTNGTDLLSFRSNDPTTIDRQITITGLDAGATVVGIDFRPATGQLYAVSSDSKLFIVDPVSGAATQVGSSAFAVPLDGAKFGVDFNPAADRLRIVSETGQNLRVNPLTGEIVDADPGTDGFQPDAALNGDATGASGAAYDQNVAGTSTTTLFAIDDVNSKLITIEPPNDGTTTIVGDLGITVDAVNGFDISGQDGAAFGAFTVAGATGLYVVDTTSGKANFIGNIDAGAESMTGLAIAPAPRAVTLFATDGTNLVSFSSDNPNVILETKALNGVTGTLVGIDFRPSDGKLYGLSDEEILYTIDPATGDATAVNAAAFTPTLDGTAFGIDFNPVADKLRVTSETATNLRINPNDGTVTEDPDLNGDTTDLTAVAYTNNFAGTTATTLFGINTATDELFIVTDPNAGTTKLVGGLGIDAEAVNGFEISAVDNTAYAALDVAGVTRLYEIDLANGLATVVGAVGDGATAYRGLTAALPGLIGFSTATVTVAEDAGTAKVTLTRTGDTSVESEVQVIVSGGIATIDNDFKSLPTTAVFAPGETTVDVIIDIVDDTEIEGDETITLGLSSPTLGFGIGTEKSLTVTITDNEVNPDAGTITILDPIVNVAEDASTATITLSRTGSTTGTATVTLEATAASTATAGADFDGLPQTITFLDGESTKDVTIAILDDADAESVESIIVSITTPSAGVTIGAPNEGVITIEDNDGGSKNAGTIAFSKDAISVDENAGTASITLTRTDSTTGNAAVEVTVTGGTATDGTDYEGLPQVVVFADGEDTKTVTFSILDDSDIEDAETILLGLSNAGTGVTIGTPAAATVTINDNDASTSKKPTSVSTTGFYAAGVGRGAPPRVNIYNPDGTLKSSLSAFDAAFTGGVRVAYADVNGDGAPDLIAASGPGSAVAVRVFDITNSNKLLYDIAPFEASFTGGAYVTAGDLDGDDKAEIIISPDEGGGPRVQIRSGADGTTMKDFFGIEDINFRGGVRTSVGDLNADGQLDLLVGAGFGGGPRLAVFDGSKLAAFNPTSATEFPPKLFPDFFVFEQTLRNGVFVASGDIDGNGSDDLIAGAGPGGGPRIYGISGPALITSQGKDQVVLTNYFAGDVNNRGGIRVVVKDIDGDNRADIVTSSGDGAGTAVNTYLGKNITEPNGTPPAEDTFNAFDLIIPGGVYVG